jgi:hypothetical protein
MDFGTHVLLKKYLDTFEEDHPLLVSFDLNPDYMEYVEKLLAELDDRPNLKTKIEEMKDISNWESTFSELEFARKLKELNPEFIRTEKGSPTPDIKAKVFGKDVFFEVRMILENDEARRVYNEIWKIESDLIVKIEFGTLDNEKADRLIGFIRNKINAKEIGSHSFEDTKIEITKKISVKTKRTAVITFFGLIEIPMEPIRKKVFRDFYSKLHQFESCSPVFWIIDCQRWKYGIDDFKLIVYGKTVEDLSVGMRLFGFEDIIKRADGNFGLFEGTNLIPTLTYPEKDGLFFLKEAECLNGIIAITLRQFHFLINPFAKKQLDSNSIRELKELFSR